MTTTLIIIICTLFFLLFTQLYFSIDKSLDGKVEEIIREEDGVFNVVSFDIRNNRNREDYHNFITKYFKTLTSTIDKAKQKIVVFDYLNYHNHMKSLRFYASEEEVNYVSSLYDSYFKSIERAVNERGVECTRVIQLPLNSKEQLSRKEQIKTFTKIILKEHYRHILEMIGCPRFNLYALKDAVRPFSFMIIDENFYVCEYARYDKNRHPLPDLLFIDTIDIDKYGGEMKFFLDKQKYLVERILDVNPEANKIPNQKSKINKNELISIREKLIEEENTLLERYVSNLGDLKSNNQERTYQGYLSYVEENISNQSEGFTSEIRDLLNKTNKILGDNDQIDFSTLVNLEVASKYFEERIANTQESLVHLITLDK